MLPVVQKLRRKEDPFYRTVCSYPLRNVILAPFFPHCRDDQKNYLSFAPPLFPFPAVRFIERSLFQADVLQSTAGNQASAEHAVKAANAYADIVNAVEAALANITQAKKDVELAIEKVSLY